MKKLIFFVVLFSTPLSFGMFGGSREQKADSANLAKLVEYCIANDVDFKESLKSLAQPLDANKKEVLVATQQRASEDAKAQQEKYRADDSKWRVQEEQEKTKQADIRAQRDTQIAYLEKEKANAAANAEKEAQKRVQLEREKSAQEHQQRMNQIAVEKAADQKRMEEAKDKERENNRIKTDQEKAANKEVAEYQNQLHRGRDEENRVKDEEVHKKKLEKETKEKEKQLAVEKKRLQDKADYEKESIDRTATAEQKRRDAEAKADKERIEREQTAHTARMKEEAETAKIKAKANAEKEKEVLNHKVALYKDPAAHEAIQAMNKEESDNLKERSASDIKVRIEQMKKAFFEFTDSPDRRKAVGTFIAGTTIAIAGGILAFRHALPVIRQLVENALFTPVLIEESSYSIFGSWFARNKKKDAEKFENLYFDPAHQQIVNEIKMTLASTKKNKGYYMNYLFYGPPGTGKTATARALAYESGMDFAFMTGGSVLDLLRSGKGIQRLKEVFKWASKSKKGVVLFIDEADAFLGDPNGDMSEELNSMLKAFLNYTGTESKDFCLILSTNHPGQLSKAVLSRVGYRQQIKFDVPGVETRKKIVAYFMQKYLARYMPHTDSATAYTARVNYIADQTQGFSGRDISYLTLGIEKATLAKGLSTINKATVEQVVNEAVAGFNQAQHFASYA